MKFPVGGKVITVCEEEEYMVSHFTSFLYVEVEGEFHETPFQAFESVQVIKATRSEEKKCAVLMSSLKDSIAVVEAGHLEGWSRALDLPPKFDKFGLNFSPASQGSAPRAPNVSTPVKFSSASFSKMVKLMLLVTTSKVIMKLTTGFTQVFQERSSTIGILRISPKSHSIISKFMFCFLYHAKISYALPKA